LSKLYHSKGVVWCSRCVMNTECDAEIQFNDSGVCNHCIRYKSLLPSRVLSGEAGELALKTLVSKIKKKGSGKQYDCLIGVSGGVDSSYVAYLTRELGLRPLAVHFDNGWNSELAVSNITSLLNQLNIDLITCVIDWEMFRDLQLAFLRASTPDGEIPTDHAINALLWKTAVDHNIKFIISGMNFATESITVPSWAYGHSDWKYIRDVQKKFGRKRLKNYPHFSLFWLMWANIFHGVRTVSLLNYVDYSKDSAQKTLTSNFDWTPYEGKHFESVYTRFFQGYVLPKKFSIDKRYGHYSDLINAGQMRREEALDLLHLPTYNKEAQNSDREYVIKKLAISVKEFDEIMKLPIKSFRNYKNQYTQVQMLRGLVNLLRRIGLYAR